VSSVKLVQEYPSMDDYCQVLRAIASGGDNAGSEQFNQCMAVLTMWSVGIAKGSLR
jgi:hypothetical protein